MKSRKNSKKKLSKRKLSKKTKRIKGGEEPFFFHLKSIKNMIVLKEK